MPNKDNFDKDIADLQDNLVRINAAEAEERIKNLSVYINKRKLNMDNFSPFESFYVHSQLHFFYHMTNPPIDKSNIINLHQDVVKLIPHQDFDYLDKNKILENTTFI